jgi:hypothetical protein
LKAYFAYPGIGQGLIQVDNDFKGIANRHYADIVGKIQDRGK